MDKSAKMQLLDAWREYQDSSLALCQAYFAAKYKDWKGALNMLELAELRGLDEKLAATLMEAIRKEQSNESA